MCVCGVCVVCVWCVCALCVRVVCVCVCALNYSGNSTQKNIIMTIANYGLQM